MSTGNRQKTGTACALGAACLYALNIAAPILLMLGLTLQQFSFIFH